MVTLAQVGSAVSTSDWRGIITVLILVSDVVLHLTGASFTTFDTLAVAAVAFWFGSQSKR